MKTITISDNQYNNFINSLTAEQQAMLENSSIDAVNPSSISCRILSNNEYDKYIKIDSLDGTIVPNDINVWNYELYEDVYSACGDGICSWGTNPDPTITRVVRHTYMNGYYYGQWTIDDKKIELIQNNTNQQSYLALPKEILLKSYSSAWNRYGYEAYYGLYTNNLSSSILKDKTDTNCSEYVQSYCRYDSKDRYTNITLNFNIAFRSAFQYKDNNKSENLYY